MERTYTVCGDFVSSASILEVQMPWNIVCHVHMCYYWLISFLDLTQYISMSKFDTIGLRYPRSLPSAIVHLSEALLKAFSTTIMDNNNLSHFSNLNIIENTWNVFFLAGSDFTSWQQHNSMDFCCLAFILWQCWQPKNSFLNSLKYSQVGIFLVLYTQKLQGSISYWSVYHNCSKSYRGLAVHFFFHGYAFELVSIWIWSR